MDGIEQRRHEEGTEHVGVLERAGRAAELGEDVRARQQGEIADETRGAGQQRRNRQAGENEPQMLLGLHRDEAGENEGRTVKIDRNGGVRDGFCEFECRQRGQQAEGAGGDPRHQQQAERRTGVHQADDRQNNHQCEGEDVGRAGLGEHEAARRHGEPDEGQRHGVHGAAPTKSLAPFRNERFQTGQHVILKSATSDIRTSPGVVLSGMQGPGLSKRSPT